jgi:hypothetical protein
VRLTALLCAVALVICPACRIVAQEQETVAPEPIVDPLRPLRIKQRDAWAKLADMLHAKDDPQSQLLSAWALFHQFDVDYFSLAEADPEELLKHYEARCQAWRKKLAEQTDPPEHVQLAIQEIDALLDDIEANRLQYARPEGDDNRSPELRDWHDKLQKFQTRRTQAMQERGRRILAMYRAGELDAVRPCVALLERQIGERVLLEEQELNASKDEATAFAQKRRALLDKQRGEWKRMRELLPQGAERTALLDIGEKICHLHSLTLDLLTARLDSEEASPESEAKAEMAALAKRVFAAYQDLHRASAAHHGEGKLTLEQLARIHDLRMYTTIWSDPAFPPADVVADGFEVAETWNKIYEQLLKAEPEGIDTQIALAKKLESEIARDERKGTPPPSASPSK